MIRPILFRGGMFGDLILGILDPSCLLKTTLWQKEYGHSTCAGQNIKYTRTYLKKFFLYNNDQKHRYYRCLASIKRPVYFLTHDTDFSQHYKSETTQLVCSDLAMLDYFAQRFEKLHRPKVIDETKKLIKNSDDFIQDYIKSLKLWQEAFVFPNRFDIKNIFDKSKFLDDLNNHFKIADPKHAETIYDCHMNSLNL
jgi:hypothetical protein